VFIVLFLFCDIYFVVSFVMLILFLFRWLLLTVIMPRDFIVFHLCIYR